jgi:ribonuclease HI
MRPKSGIVVDGSSRGNPGPSGYKAIDLETGQELFNIKIGDSTNNIAEFIGLVHAISYAIKNGYKDVYCDSITAISWVRNKRANSTLLRNSKTEKSIDLMHKAEAHISTFPPNFFSMVRKWETRRWGENEADFGFKK